MLRKSFWASMRAVLGLFHPVQGQLWVSALTKTLPRPSTEQLPQIPSPRPKGTALEKPRGEMFARSFVRDPCQPGAYRQGFKLPLQLTLHKDLLPELEREAGSGEAQVDSHQLKDVGLQQVPDLCAFLQSRVLEHLQQQGETLFNLQREKKSHCLWSRVSPHPRSPARGTEIARAAAISSPSDTTSEAEKGF